MSPFWSEPARRSSLAAWLLTVAGATAVASPFDAIESAASDVFPAPTSPSPPDAAAIGRVNPPDRLADPYGTTPGPGLMGKSPDPSADSTAWRALTSCGCSKCCGQRILAASLPTPAGDVLGPAVLGPSKIDRTNPSDRLRAQSLADLRSVALIPAPEPAVLWTLLGGVAGTLAVRRRQLRSVGETAGR